MWSAAVFHFTTDELFKLIEILGSYHITVKQVKTIFKLFQVDDTAFKSYYWQNIFPLLQRLWHGRDGRPNDYFELDGYNSGLLLPPLKLPGGGYSIGTWVFVSSFTSNYHRETYQPYLFSFLTEDGTGGVEAHFNRGKLVLRTNPQHSNTSKREMRIVNYDFEENRWYFIALTHTKKLILSDECHVYVNGESVQHFNLKYPKPEQPLKSARLGTAGTIPEPRSCMRGKLGGFLAFDDTLNADEVRALYHQGPNLFSSLQPLERLVLMPRSRLARRPNVLFFYSPRATDCSICLEPWSNDPTRRANMLPGVRSCITTGFQDALSSVGGIQLLLPLFSSQYRPSSGENIDVNTKVLSLLIELVTDNEFALMEMLRARFFQIMGYLLATDFNQASSAEGPAASSSASSAPLHADMGFSTTAPGEPVSTASSGTTSSSSASAQKGKASSNKWSPQAIEVLDKLANAVAKFRATNAARTNGPLFEQIIRHVYLNFKIWSNADYEVQLALLKSINTFSKRDPELLHSFFSVSQMMLILNEHFTYHVSNDDSTVLERRAHTQPNLGSNYESATISSGKVDWMKRPRSQLVELRKALLSSLHCFIQVGISLKETKALVNYLHHEALTKPEERRLITDLLQVLLICIGEKHMTLLHHINTLGNLAIFLPLLKAENERFRVWTLKVIGKLIQNADLDPNHKDSILQHLPSIRKVLEPYPLSHHTYNVLLEILIDAVSADGLINPVDFALHPSTAPGSAPTTLKNLKMISVIFQLLNGRSEIELRAKVLKDFVFYLKRGPENRSRFIAQHDWQAWILSLLIPETTPTPPSSGVTGMKNTMSTSGSGKEGKSLSHSSGHSRSASGGAAPAGALSRRLHNSRAASHLLSQAAVTPAAGNTGVDSAAYATLQGLATEIFALVFETTLLSSGGSSSVFEGTSAVLRRMASINGFDAVSIANTINTKVLKTLAENNIVSRCKASPATFQCIVQYLAFVESTFFRTPTAPSSLHLSNSTTSQLGREPSSPSLNASREALKSSGDSSSSETLGPGRGSGTFSGTISGATTPTIAPTTAVFPVPPIPSASAALGPGEKDTLRFSDRPLLPLWLHYSTNGQWISFTLAQRILDLVDQLVLNKIERTPTMEIAPEMLDRLEAALSRFRTRLILYSIAEGATFKSTARLRLRKESIRNIRQVIFDGFTSASSKSLSTSAEMAAGGVHASLARYLTKKAKQWDTEMSDVDSMFHKNIKRIRALVESTPSTSAALYLLAYIGALVQKANSSPLQASTDASTSSSSLSSALAPSAIPPRLHNTHGTGSAPNLMSMVGSPSRGSTETPPPGSPPQVQQADESVHLAIELWRDAIINIRQRLSSDPSYGAIFSRLEGEVLTAFFDTGFAIPKDFVLAPAIEKAIDYIVANDMNAMNATQNAMKAVSDRYTDLTQAESMTELQAHKTYEQEYLAVSQANVSAMKEASSLYDIRHSQYVSIIANQWKNLLRVLHDTRGPWSSPYSVLGEDFLANPDLHTAAAATAGLQMTLNAAMRGGAKMYWKLDSTENSQRMRLKLKRHYGDVSVLENASAKNDEKERLLIESLQYSSLGSSAILSPSASMSSLPPFDMAAATASSASSTTPAGSAAQTATLNRVELLKLVARRGNATALDEDDAAGSLIDTEYGIGEDEAKSQTVTPSASSSSIGTPTQTPAPGSAAAAARAEERTLLLTTCEYVKGIATMAGDFEVTTQNIYFRNLEQGAFKMIPLEKLRAIYSRRYMLRNTALEIFTTSHTSHFFTFDKETPSKVMKIIVDKARPVNLREYFAGSSAALARKKKHITEAWRKRQISNFEYLMELNTIAGRSYNDLSQYPVFPWIISDYESDKIDLNNPGIYRDLSKPIGALEPSRLEKFMVRWDEMVKSSNQARDDDDVSSMSAVTPPFMYGSHYSSHSIVLFYLLRMEPFTSQSLELQGGSFDLPARLFTSIPDTWRNCLINQSDVKELIPEFFFLSSFLHDTNDVNVGFLKPKEGAMPTSIDSVQLPPWASSPQAFIQMNRLALESDYVSAHLHEWVDLIFGHKQLGQDAVDAHNVFYYTSYEGNIDIDSIADPTLKQSVQMQIREFGQTPSRLFTTPHPVRLSLEESQKAKRNALASLVATALTGASAEQEWKPTAADLGKTIALTMRPNTVAYSDLISIHVDSKNERFILVFMDGLVQTVGFKIPRGKRFPLSLSVQWNEADVINSAQKKEEHSLENSASAPGLDPGQNCFAYLDTAKVLFNCGSWDRSLTLSSVASSISSLQSVQEHTDVVTCLALSQDHESLISASRDCNVLVWDVEDFALKKKDNAVAPKPKFVLFGHDDDINSVAVNSDLSVIVSASQDCTAIVYDLNKGRYIRTIPHDSPVSLVAVSKYGDIVTYCSAGEILSLHSINGTLLQRLSGVGKLSALKFSQDGQLLVTAGQNSITVRSLFQYSLKRIYLWKCPTAVSSIELFNQDEYLLIGLCDGTLLTVIFDMNKLLTEMSREMAMEKAD